jgi:transcriptional/translational regulatory protein YebC/TACO1
VIYVYTDFAGFGPMQKALEQKGINIINSELQRVPNTTVELTPEQEADIQALVEKFEEDDDVQNVFHNMK